MENHKEHLKDLSDIRSMMDRSSRFLSLSGLSGIFAGIYALIGAYYAYTNKLYRFRNSEYAYYSITDYAGITQIYEVVIVGAVVLALSLITGYLLTRRNSVKKGLPLWDKTAKRMLGNLAIPLVTGGIACLILLVQYSSVYSIAPLTLVFYGLALVNASKYTLNDIRYLGICEIILGLIALLYPANGLLFWAIGFGVLHIVYGTVMYFKYER